MSIEERVFDGHHHPFSEVKSQRRYINPGSFGRVLRDHPGVIRRTMAGVSASRLSVLPDRAAPWPAKSPGTARTEAQPSAYLPSSRKPRPNHDDPGSGRTPRVAPKFCGTPSSCWGSAGRRCNLRIQTRTSGGGRGERSG